MGELENMNKVDAITKIDLHMHTRVSDGTDSPMEIIDRVKEAGISFFSVTDHDAIQGCLEIGEFLGKDRKEATYPFFVNGVEFSSRDELGKYHILGYGYNPESDAMKAAVKRSHGLRIEKVIQRLDFIKETFGFTFSKEDLRELMANPNPGKPHIGNLMVKYGYAPSRNVAIKDYLNKKHFKNKYVHPKQAIEDILNGGGIPVLAHPAYGSGDELILGGELEERILRLMEFGLQGVEAFYSGFTPKIQQQTINIAEKYDLYVTAGSDYHGSNKLVELGENHLETLADGPEETKKFIEKLLDMNAIL